jgi:hypothetical protein
MTRRVWALMLLVGLIVTLTPLAYAIPPDPSWIRGLYDGADFDDVAVLLTSGMGAVETSPLTQIEWAPIVIGWIMPMDDVSSSVPLLLQNPPRAPPAR